MFYILYLFAVTLLSSSCVAFTASTGISHRHRGLMVHDMVNKNIITEIKSEGSFEQLLENDKGSDRITVIKFHAAWCKSCQKFGMMFRKLAMEKADENVQLAGIEWGANRKLCRGLGIKRLPSVHFYYGGRKLTGFPCGPRKFPLLRENLDRYLAMSKEELEFEVKMEEGKELVEGVSSQLEESNDSKAVDDLVATAPPKTKNSTDWWDWKVPSLT